MGQEQNNVKTVSTEKKQGDTEVVSVAKEKKQSGKIWKILTCAMSVVAVCGIALSVFLLVVNNRGSDEINALKAEVADLKSELKETTEVLEVDILDEESDTMYLEPEGWGVRFAYPDGVTEVEYGMNDNYDGALSVTSITTSGGKTYDIEMCGGKDAYVQYPFFLGNVYRWNPEGAHEYWQTSPARYDGMELAMTAGGYEYYVGSGNGCDTGDDNADYQEALGIVEELMGNIEEK